MNTSLKQQLISQLNPMYVGEDLISKFTCLPDYSENMHDAPVAMRILALSDLYDLYIPLPMSIDIYNKVYIALLNSLHKKCTNEAIDQRYKNAKAINKIERNGIIGGADSFTIIGTSGIGKSSALNRAVSLITNDNIISLKSPYVNIIPCLVVQCPFDCSVKGLMINILEKTDQMLGDKSNYSKISLYNKTLDMLIGRVSQVLLNHVGILVVDEIQNVVTHKSGNSLINALTQLINSSGVSVGMVGTPECMRFFESAMHLARRSVGIKVDVMGFGDDFNSFCSQLFQFQYTKNKIALNSPMTEWLYKHSMGIASVIISLFHDAQELAILNGMEEINITVLEEAYKKRLTFLHKYIEQPSIKQHSSKYKKNSFNALINTQPEKALDLPTDYVSIVDLANMAKKQQMDPVKIYQEYFSIEEVNI